MPSRDPARNRAASRRHYQRHKEDYFARNRLVRAQKLAFIRATKEVPCTDCGVQYPHYVMEYDHLRDKIQGVGAMANRSWKQILAEIAKCEVVCANCHAVRTFQRAMLRSLGDAEDETSET